MTVPQFPIKGETTEDSSVDAAVPRRTCREPCRARGGQRSSFISGVEFERSDLNWQVEP
jgi:hypothetical protein